MLPLVALLLLHAPCEPQDSGEFRELTWNRESGARNSLKQKPSGHKKLVALVKCMLEQCNDLEISQQQRSSSSSNTQQDTTELWQLFWSFAHQWQFVLHKYGLSNKISSRRRPSNVSARYTHTQYEYIPRMEKAGRKALTCLWKVLEVAQ